MEHDCKHEDRIIDMQADIKKVLAILDEREKGVQARQGVVIALISAVFGFAGAVVSSLTGIMR